MILRSLAVEGFRCFAGKVTVPELQPGLNVLHGPNGAGKSTLLQALRHALVDAHNVTGALVRQSMKPWGRELSPRICVAFAHGGVEWRLEKRFLSGAYSRLEREENGRFVPLAEGKAADQQVREMLAAEAAAKGAAGPGHLGWLQVLWTPQGPPLLPVWSDGVKSSVQEAFGAALQSKAGAALGELVEGRFASYYTPTGKESKNSLVPSLREQQGKFREEAERLRREWEMAAEKRSRLAELEAEHARVSARAEKLAPRLESLQVSAAEEQAAWAELEPVERRVTEWRTAIQERERLEREIADAERRRQEAQARYDEAAGVQKQREAMEAELAGLKAEGVDANAWGDLLRARRLRDREAVLRREMEALQAPAEAALRTMRQTSQELQVKQASLAAASLRVTIEAESALEMETADGARPVGAGGTLELTSPERVTVRIPGVARITAASANAQAAGLAREVEGLERRMTELLGGQALTEWEDRFTRAQGLRGELDQVAAEWRPLQSRAAEFRELAARRPEWEQSPPDVDAIRARWKEVKERLDRIPAKVDTARLAAEAATAGTVAAEKTKQRDAVAGKLAEYAASGSLDAWEQRNRDARLRWDSAREKRAAIAGDPAALREELEGLRGRERDGREAAARLRGELSVYESQSVYTRLGEAEAQLADVTARGDRESRRAAAVMLLRTELAAAQRSLTASLPDRIAEEATRYWRRIAGPAAPAIRMTESWMPGGLATPEAEAAIDQVSGGEMEQIAFATRLALAMQLSREERQLAVFDDSFLATDPERAGRILAMLAESAGRLQILVLTCHPERYAAMPGVHSMDLERLRA